MNITHAAVFTEMFSRMTDTDVSFSVRTGRNGETRYTLTVTDEDGNTESCILMRDNDTEEESFTFTAENQTDALTADEFSENLNDLMSYFQYTVTGKIYL